MPATLTATLTTFDLEMYQAALVFAGLPTNNRRIFQRINGTFKSVSLERIDPAYPAWIQMNLTRPNFPLKKPDNKDITVYQNLTLDFELVNDPIKAVMLGGQFVQKLIEAELALPGQPVEDTGAGCHIVIPLMPIAVTDFGGAENVNSAVALVVEKYYKPIFNELVNKAGLTGQMKLEAFDISRLLSLPGTWRPGGLKENEHESLLPGHLRCWLYPYVGRKYPERCENELVTDLIKAACVALQNEEKPEKPAPKSLSNVREDASSWIRSYADQSIIEDRSVSFHRLVAATYLKFDEDTVRANARLIDDLTGNKYAKRVEAEAERSLVKATQLSKTDFAEWVSKQGYDSPIIVTTGSQEPPPPAIAAPTPAAPLNPHKMTDLGNARRLVERFGQDLRFVKEWGWMVWDGRRWQLDRTGASKRIARKTVSSIYIEAGQLKDESKQAELAKFAIKSESKASLDAMLSLAESEVEVVARPEDFDRDPWLLNCLNGTLNLKTGELLPHSRDNLISKLTPIAYDKFACCPTWIDFLESIMDKNYELINYIKRILGYSLTGLTTEQCLFLLWGTGRNGKSTLIETITALLGDYGQTSTFKTFLDKNSDGPNNDVAKLAGARFVSAVEADPGKRLAESVIKQLTGGDTVSARFLHKEFFEFKPNFKLFLAANHKPVIRGQDLGIWRRIKLIPFEVTIAEDQVDRKLPEKLRAELPGILAWSVEGCAWWQREGLMEPEEVTSATEDYKEESDILRDFIADCCVKGPRKQVELAEIYKKYVKWCEDMGEHPIAKRTFSDAVTQRGIPLRPGAKNRSTFFGIGLTIEI